MRLTLRAQIALATALIALAVVALAGAFIALRIAQRDRSMVDTQLSARADRVVADLDKLLADGSSGQQPGDDGYGELLDGTESLVRLFDGTEIVVQRGAIPDQPLAPPTQDGFSTLLVDGTPWRSYTVSSDGSDRVQVLQSLDAVNDRRAANTRLVVVITLLAALLSGAAGWAAGSRMLRPLDRLAVGATAIAHDPDPQHRLPSVAGPAELAALSSALNGMLDRLGAGAETTRRFAADVGHELRGPLTAAGAYLETLLASPDLSESTRVALVAVDKQQRRMVTTLNSLQVLARVDAGALPPREIVEPGVLVEELVRLARQRHPSVAFTFTDTSDGATVLGWREGLRIAANNLLDNAAVHGRPSGNVDVTVAAENDVVRIRVDDDGPGIAPDDRTPLRERFTRGAAATSPGTGLGLALVDQQARIHSGDLILGTSRLGGLSAEIVLAANRH